MKNFIFNLKSYSKKKFTIFFLLLAPFSFNLIFNFLSGQYNYLANTANFYDLISTFLIFLFLYYLGSNIKILLNLNTTSFGIVIFLTSYFVFDLHTLLIFKSISFHNNFLIVSLAWLAIVLIRIKNAKSLLYVFLSYFTMRVFNTLFVSKITTNSNIIGDVEAIFYDQSINIYENSYSFSVINFIDEGYPQFSSYLQSLIHKLSFSSEFYVYYVSTTQLIYFLTILFFYELEIKNYTKYYLVFLYTVLVFNNQFYQFLFTSSLMSEGVISFILMVVTYEGLNSSLKNKLSKFIFLSLGILYLTKQFINTFYILFLIFCLFNRKLRKYIFYGLYIPIIKEINYLFNFNEVSGGHHLSQIDISQTIIDLITLNNLNLLNILIILQKIWMDKPLALFIILLIIATLFHFAYFGFSNLYINTYLSLIVMNILFILALYVSAWKNMELESPIRFLLTFLNLKLVIFGLIIDNFVKKIST